MDLFYYGSQDVPLPLGRGGRSANGRSRGEDAVYCESCSAPVPVGDLKGGRAAEMFGLILCENCRLKTSAEERVELYFCDRCQVSVPVYRVDTGEALAGDGRILCISCRERSTSIGRFARVGIFAALLLAILALGILLAPDLRPAASAPPPDVGAFVRSALDVELPRAGLSGAGSGLLGRLETLDTRLEEARESSRSVLERVADMRASFTTLREDLDDRMDLLEAEADRFDREVDILLTESAPRR